MQLRRDVAGWVHACDAFCSFLASIPQQKGKPLLQKDGGMGCMHGH